jgi:hypothetical protein
MNIGNGNEFSRILIFLSILAVLCRKSYKFRTYTTDIHKIIHKNKINDYSSAFRTPQYKPIFDTNVKNNL